MNPMIAQLLYREFKRLQHALWEDTQKLRELRDEQLHFEERIQSCREQQGQLLEHAAAGGEDLRERWAREYPGLDLPNLRDAGGLVT
jgi:hypothetical protein